MDTLAALTAGYEAIAAFTAPNLAKITGFELLSITDALATGKNLDLSKVAGLTSFQTVGVATGGTATVSNVGANATVIIKGDIDTNDGALVVSLKDATGSSDVLNLTLNDLYTEDNTAGPATIEASNAFVVTASGVETINLTSTGTASTKFLGATGTVADGVNNTLTLTNTALVTLNVSGDQAITFNTADAQTKLATIDASANTGGAEISAVGTITATNAALTIKGSATAANTLTGSANADTIIGGSKADTINSSAKADTITLGGGNDTYVLLNATHSTVAARDVITDFSANSVGVGADGAATTAGAAAANLRNGDVIDLSGFTPALVNVAVFANASDATTFLANSAGVAAGVAVNVALDSSTGTLYIDGTDNGIADSVISLTGVTTINAAAFVV